MVHALNVHRTWFVPIRLKTESLDLLVANSRPTIEKEIRTRIREMFLDFGIDEILMTARNVNEEFFKNRFEQNYVIQVLSDEMKLEQKGDGMVCRFSYPRREKTHESGTSTMRAAEVKEIGRPFVFPVDRFLLPDEKENRKFETGTRIKHYSTELPF